MVPILEVEGNVLTVHPIRNVQFSGWVADDPVSVDIAELTGIKAFNFYSVGNKAGMQWVCLELGNRKVIEFHFETPDLLARTIDFVKSSLPEVELTMDPKPTS